MLARAVLGPDRPWSGGLRPQETTRDATPSWVWRGRIGPKYQRYFHRGSSGDSSQFPPPATAGLQTFSWSACLECARPGGQLQTFRAGDGKSGAATKTDRLQILQVTNRWALRDSHGPTTGAGRGTTARHYGQNRIAPPPFGPRAWHPPSLVWESTAGARGRPATRGPAPAWARPFPSVAAGAGGGGIALARATKLCGAEGCCRLAAAWKKLVATARDGSEHG